MRERNLLGSSYSKPAPSILQLKVGALLWNLRPPEGLCNLVGCQDIEAVKL